MTMEQALQLPLPSPEPKRNINLQVLLSHLVETCGLQVIPIYGVVNSSASLDSPSQNSTSPESTQQVNNPPEFTCSCPQGSECRCPGKHPLLRSSWKDVATNSLAKIQGWINKYDHLNFAVCTGRKSEKTGKYLIVIDVDDPEHEILKTLPKTFSYRTGSGGYHFWYWTKIMLKNTVSDLAEKVDTRGEGGYVVIPPSFHITGRFYELLYGETCPIEDIPEDLLASLEHIRLSKDRNRRNAYKKPTKGPTSAPSSSGKTSNNKLLTATGQWWRRDTPVATLRQVLSGGVKIPQGLRNSVVFRLLSSDRARGAATHGDLFALAQDYRRNNVECPETLNNRELSYLVNSVMRYPVYNTEAGNVNKNYARWMKRKHDRDLDVKTLETMDDLFFSKCSPTPSPNNNPSRKPGIPLLELAKVREEWYKDQGQTEFARYKTQLLAKKLISLGYRRTRTSSQNLWNVDISGIFSPVPSLEAPPEIPILHETPEAPKKQGKNKLNKKPVDKNLVTEISASSSSSSSSSSSKKKLVDKSRVLCHTSPKSLSTLNIQHQEKRKLFTMTLLSLEENVDAPVDPVAITERPIESPTSHAETSSTGKTGDDEVQKAPRLGPIGPDGDPLTFLEEREEVIEAKAKYHPNDYKYAGRESSQEQLSALVKLYSSFTPDQRMAYKNGVLLYDEERTRDWMEAVQPEDVVGLKGTMYQVLSVNEEELRGAPRAWDNLNRRYLFSEEETKTFSIYDVDMALNLGLGEILYRNAKPFGVEQEMSYKVKVSVWEDKLGRTYVFKTGRKVENSSKDTSSDSDSSSEDGASSEDGVENTSESEVV